LVQVRQESFDLVRANAADVQKDWNGATSDMLSLDLRFFGVAAYVLHGDVSAFKTNLAEAAAMIRSLFEREEQGQPIDASLLSMIAYKDVFNALAAGDMELARSLAQHMGGRDELEKKHDHPFDRAMGYTLRAFVLDQPEEMGRRAAEFSVICKDAENADFRGYSHVFGAILAKNVEMADQGLQEIVQGHKKQSKRGGVFKDTPDELLCVWGVGMANLARSRQLAVQGVSPLIPPDLLIPSLPSGSTGAR